MNLRLMLHLVVKGHTYGRDSIVSIDTNEKWDGLMAKIVCQLQGYRLALTSLMPIKCHIT